MQTVEFIAASESREPQRESSSQSRGDLEWILVFAFRPQGQKQEQFCLVPYNAANRAGFLNTRGWVSQVYNVMPDVAFGG